MQQSHNKGLRIALLMDSFDIPAWQHVMLEKVLQLENVRIELIVLSDTQKPTRSLLSKVKEDFTNLEYIAYRTFEDWLFRPKPDAMEKKDARHVLADITTIKVRPRQAGFSTWFNEEDIEKIRMYEIDIAICLGFERTTLSGAILKVPRLGIWSYSFGDDDVNRGAPVAFWEVFKRRPTTGSILRVVMEDIDDSLILDRLHAATDPLSVNRNRNKIYWKSVSSVPRKLKELHELGEEQFFDRVKADNERIRFYSERLHTLPKNKEFTKLLVKHMLRYASRKVSNVFCFDQWTLMFDLRDEVSRSFWRLRTITPPRDRFWADPYVVYRNGLYYIFFEEYICHEKKGHISIIVMNENGTYTNATKVLDKPYHLSHPFVFEWDSDIYMIPESIANRTIELYQCTEFPHKWELRKCLMNNIVGEDATLYCYRGRWWLFVHVTEYEGFPTGGGLFVFYSNDPLSGDWTPHPLNPVVSDVRKSRSAGRIFQHEGDIYRPAQDSSIRYGYGIRINRILRLNETEYHEKEAAFIEPNWAKKLRRTHTLNHVNRLTIVDGAFRRWKSLARITSSS
jgi:hypothetical protein